MLRSLLLALSVVVASSCAGFRPVERGEYRRVYAEDATRRTPDAPQEFISRDDYEAEVADGLRRAWEPPMGYAVPLLHETPALSVAVGQVVEVRVDEAREPDLLLEGGVVEAFWNPPAKRDEWRDGQDVTLHESTLWLRGRKAGRGTLRLVRGRETLDVPITVTGP
jgi:hypothetical protein